MRLVHCYIGIFWRPSHSLLAFGLFESFFFSEMCYWGEVQRAPAALRANRDFMLAAVRTNGNALEDASEGLKRDAARRPPTGRCFR